MCRTLANLENLFPEIIGLYLDEKADMSEVRNMLACLGCINGAIFESILPFYDYLTRDPPVVETNKVHGCEYILPREISGSFTPSLNRTYLHTFTQISSRCSSSILCSDCGPKQNKQFIA